MVSKTDIENLFDMIHQTAYNALTATLAKAEELAIEYLAEDKRPVEYEKDVAEDVEPKSKSTLESMLDDVITHENLQGRPAVYFNSLRDSIRLGNKLLTQQEKDIIVKMWSALPPTYKTA